MEHKKTPKADLLRKSRFFLAIGLCASLGLTLLAFEWKQYDLAELMDLGMVNEDFEALLEIPPTEQPQPTPPPIQQPQLREVPNDEEIDDIEIIIDVAINEDEAIEEIIFESEPIEEVAEEIFLVVEQQAKFPGGTEAWNNFLRKNLKYPRQATRMGIQGRVFLSFVVDQSGNISDIQLTRGIGGGCDEEALRVLKNSPKWAPGEQRGRAVKSRMSLQIQFKLN